jgi:hypothetical protein
MLLMDKKIKNISLLYKPLKSHYSKIFTAINAEKSEKTCNRSVCFPLRGTEEGKIAREINAHISPLDIYALGDTF